MKTLSIVFILLGMAVLIIGILELRAGLQIQSFEEMIGPENIHLPEDIIFVELADKLAKIQNYRIVQSITVSALSFVAAYKLWKTEKP